MAVSVDLGQVAVGDVPPGAVEELHVAVDVLRVVIAADPCVDDRVGLVEGTEHGPLPVAANQASMAVVGLEDVVVAGEIGLTCRGT
jgi:hypothetical protein